MGPAPRERLVAAIGVAVGLGMILMKIVPAIPGHFSGYEWLALAVWGLIGMGLGWRERALAVASAKEIKREAEPMKRGLIFLVGVISLIFLFTVRLSFAEKPSPS